MKLRTFIGPDGEVAVPAVMVEFSGVDDKGKALVRVGSEDVPLRAFLNERGARSTPMVVARLQQYNPDGSVELAPPGSGGGGGDGSGPGYTDEQVRDVIGAALRQGTGVTISYDDASDTITIGLSVTPGDMFKAQNLAGITDPSAARGNLMLGSAATYTAGTGPGNLPVLDGGGKLLGSVLPAVAITDTFVVNSQAEMLALVAQRGDVAIRQDLSRSFILQTDSSSTLADWKELLTPTDVVQSVAGLQGAISAAALRSALSLVIGTDVQAYDGDLAAIAALPTVDFGRQLLTKNDAASIRDYIGAAASGATGGSSRAAYRSQQWYTSSEADFAPGGTAGAANGGLIFLPLFLKEGVTLDAIGVRVTTVSSGGVFQLGLYAHSAATGKPTGSLLGGSTGLSAASQGTIQVNFSPNLPVTPPVVWAAFQAGDATSRFYATSPTSLAFVRELGAATQDLVATTGGGSNSQQGWIVTNSPGTWPDVTNATLNPHSGASAAYPLIEFRKA